MDKIINNVFIPYEPKKTNRFIVRFPKSFNLPEWVCFETSRPTLRIVGEAKNVIWDDLVVKMYDPIGPSTTKALMDLVYENKIIDKFSFDIEMLDPTGVVVEKWQLDNCEFKSIEFGNLSYNNDESVKCIITIKLKDVVLLF
jgi:hypothetical protein